jgi:hypothetical protein
MYSVASSALTPGCAAGKSSAKSRAVRDEVGEVVVAEWALDLRALRCATMGHCWRRVPPAGEWLAGRVVWWE